MAKATFYRHFPSKDDLVVAWLQDPHTRWLDRVRREAEAHHAEPSEVIPLFFEVLADWLETEGYRGCPYLNTAVEIVDPAHPARAAIRDYLDESEAYDYSIDAAGEPDCGARGLPVRITLLDGR